MKSSRKNLVNRNIFPKYYRLLSKPDFNFLGGESIYDSPLKCVFKSRESKVLQSRLGIAVSKKYSKSAVKRNHAKRILRESFRNSKIRDEGYDMLAILAKPIEGYSKKQISSLIFKKFKSVEGRILWAQIKKEH